jgi:hypothetical protein
MTHVRTRLVPLGALLATLLAPPTSAQPETASEQGNEPMSPDNPHYASGYLAIGVDYYEGRSSKAELEARVAEMSRNRSWRRKDHAEGIKELWGARVLSHPDCREELRVHARREAYGYRALFLAHTDPSVKERPSLVARIERIVDAEDARHQKAIERLGGVPGGAAPGAATAPPAGGK